MKKNNLTYPLSINDHLFFVGKLSALYAFIEIAHYKSFRSAAQKMFVSPQALNKQVTALEKSLGLPLINRSPRGFSLTDYGEYICKYTPILIRNMHQLQRDLAAMYAKNNHILRLAYSNDLYNTTLHSYIMNFQNEEPSCNMILKHLNSDQIMTVASGKESYITITTHPSNTALFDVTILYKAQYHFLIHKDNPLSQLDEVELGDFKNAPLILCSEFFKINQYVLKNCTEQKISMDVSFETEGFQASLEKCRQNKGALLMADYIEKHLDTEDLIKVVPKDGPLSLNLVMLTRKDLDYSPMELKFIKYMASYPYNT